MSNNGKSKQIFGMEPLVFGIACIGIAGVGYIILSSGTAIAQAASDAAVATATADIAASMDDIASECAKQAHEKAQNNEEAEGWFSDAFDNDDKQYDERYYTAFDNCMAKANVAGY